MIKILFCLVSFTFSNQSNGNKSKPGDKELMQIAEIAAKAPTHHCFTWQLKPNEFKMEINQKVLIIGIQKAFDGLMDVSLGQGFLGEKPLIEQLLGKIFLYPFSSQRPFPAEKELIKLASLYIAALKKRFGDDFQTKLLAGWEWFLMDGMMIYLNHCNVYYSQLIETSQNPNLDIEKFKQQIFEFLQDTFELYAATINFGKRNKI